jgi:hypothetical protein
MTRDELCFFNFISEASSNQPELAYEQLCADVVRAVVGGYNGTVIMHGKSSSSDLMMGTARDPGLVVLGLAELFDSIRRTPGEFVVSLKFTEIVGDATRGQIITISAVNFC